MTLCAPSWTVCYECFFVVVSVDGYIKAAVRFTSTQTECLNITETQFGLFWKCSQFLYQNEFHMPYAAQHSWSIDDFIKRPWYCVHGNFIRSDEHFYEHCDDYTELYMYRLREGSHFHHIFPVGVPVSKTPTFRWTLHNAIFLYVLHLRFQ